MLSEHPDIEKRLRQEIISVVGQTGRPTYDHMREMKYMRAFINGMCLEVGYSMIFVIYELFFFAEVLRLYPPVLVVFSCFSFPRKHVYVYVYIAARLIAGMKFGSS